MELRHINLLLIEDDLVDQLAFRRFEKDNPGFGPYKIAGSVKAAQEYLEASAIDIIICDYMLGDGNAFDILDIARDIPVIIITGAGNEEVAIKALRMGAFDYLVKDNARNYLKVLPFTIQNAIQRKRTEKEVRKLSLVTSKSNNSVIITDPSGKIEWVNEGFTRLSGYELSEVAGTSGEMLKRGDETGLSPKSVFYQELMRNKKTISFESRNYTRDSREYWTLTTLTPLLDQYDNIENIVAIDSDITERKQAEKAILSAKRAAEEAKLAEEEFIANTSHEIRTPMNGIIGMVDLLLHSQLSPQQKEYLNDIRISASKLLYIINDVLDFSKIRAGQITFESTDFSLAEVTNNISKILKKRADEKELSISCVIDPAVPEQLAGDPVRLNQVLLNLMDNAVKFTEKGEVTLLATLAERNNDEVKILFSISDTGIGIPKDRLDMIFESFKQASLDTTRKYGGTGLGLSIAQKLIQAQGSEIQVDSALNRGTTFRFQLSFKIGQKKPVEALKQEPGEMKFPRQLNVLMVEDNLINQKVLKNVLWDLGATVTITGNGKTAVDILRSNEPFDLILMDLRMPEMDGLQTTRYIRGVLPSPINATPIIAITASALPKEKENCLAIGMNDYISKPFTQEVLFEKTMNILFPEQNREKNNAAVPEKPIQLNTLQQFQRNGKNFVGEIITIFLDECPADIERIQNAFKLQDWKTVEQIAHRIAPSAAMVGLEELYETLISVEQRAIERDEASLMILLGKMDLLFKRAILDLNHYMKESSAT